MRRAARAAQPRPRSRGRGRRPGTRAAGTGARPAGSSRSARHAARPVGVLGGAWRRTSGGRPRPRRRRPASRSDASATRQRLDHPGAGAPARSRAPGRGLLAVQLDRGRGAARRRSGDQRRRRGSTVTATIRGPAPRRRGQARGRSGLTCAGWREEHEAEDRPRPPSSAAAHRSPASTVRRSWSGPWRGLQRPARPPIRRRPWRLQQVADLGQQRLARRSGRRARRAASACLRRMR